MTRLGSRIQDGNRGGGQQCRELQQQRKGGLSRFRFSKKTLLVKIKLQNPNYLTRLESRIQDGKRGGGQRCRELQQQRQGGNLRIGHASQLAASSHGIPTQISGLLKTRLNQPRSTTTVPSGLHDVSFLNHHKIYDFHC